MIDRRQALIGGVATGMATAAGPFGRASAQTYPGSQTIKVVVGFPPGGAQDIVGRIVADRLADHWKASVVVENVVGAGGNLAMDRVAKGPADGTQLLIAPPGITTNQYLYAKLPFNPDKDFIPLGLVASIPNLLVVKKDLPVSNVAELVAYAKANPGKLNCASTGIGTTTHLSAELFKRMTGTEIVVVHYRGSAIALNDLLGGSIDMIFDNISSSVPHARAGAVKALGISTLAASSLAPEYPPISATVPGYETTSWGGVAVRAGTPKEICAKIEAGVIAICKDALLRDRLASLVSEAVGLGADDTAKFFAAESVKWGKLITDLKIRVGD